MEMALSFVTNETISNTMPVKIYSQKLPLNSMIVLKVIYCSENKQKLQLTIITRHLTYTVCMSKHISSKIKAIRHS